jgi:hypothetical protein
LNKRANPRKRKKEREDEEREGERALRITRRSYKGLWWMPWRQMPTKDVGHCEKLRGAVYRRRSVDIRMGKPAGDSIDI